MNKNKQSAFLRLSIKFFNISLRERTLILVAGLVVIVLLAYTFLLEPSVNTSSKLKRDILLAQSEQVTFQQQISDINQKFKNDPNVVIRERIDILNQEIMSLDAKLQDQTSNLVPATQMANMLENVLLESKGIKLNELASIAPTPIFLSKPDQDNKNPTADLYQHGVRIVLQGSYFDIHEYLEKLESLQWKFYWKKFDYHVDAYPKGLIELEIYTLSTSKAFIGV
jgi:MSHA biogenesis protein MshJ